jgi:glutamate-ammonia-ligase adenylyltransferase
MQLEHQQAFHPQLSVAADALTSTGLLPPAFGDAQALLTRLLVLLRLVAPDSETPPEPAQILVAQALGFGDWTNLMTAVTDAKATISAVWQDYKETAK